MALGRFGRTPVGNCDLAQRSRRVPDPALRLCTALARDCFNCDCEHSSAVEYSIRIPKRAGLGFVRPNRSATAIERPLLVVSGSDLAESAPANLSLLPNSRRVRGLGLALLRSQLETRNTL